MHKMEPLPTVKLLFVWFNTEQGCRAMGEGGGGGEFDENVHVIDRS